MLGIKKLLISNRLSIRKIFVGVQHAAKKPHENFELFETDSEEDEKFAQLSEQFFSSVKDHNCYIIHPFIKWGAEKVRDTNPQRQLDEAIALIRTLAPWKVAESVSVPLETFDKKRLFGSGTLETLRQKVCSTANVTSVFVNVSTLKNVQIEELEAVFHVPILDRYRVVMQILRRHAISKHAKLQVALAEIPYLRGRIKQFDSKFIASGDPQTRRLLLQNRETKIKNEIKKLRSQRELLRKKRRDVDFPMIAVVGYTNAGKTSLIKALTGDANLNPRNQLFATLDVTMHAGVLPCNLEVLFVDTVGFISNIPTTLIECFVATLEDAMFADVILHVEDVSNEDYLFQRRHVLETLGNLALKMDVGDLSAKIVTVGNKCDAQRISNPEGLIVSAKTSFGLDELTKQLQSLVIQRTGRIQVTFRIPIGGDEIRWLYKNAAIVDTAQDDANPQLQNVRCVISKAKLQQFRHNFIHS